MNEINFYTDLQPLNIPITGVFQQQYFSNVPDSWHVIISDVKNSTAAVSAGKHNDVNLVAAGSLIAVLNIVKKYKIEIPFFFGGDGGTVLVPEQILNDASIALLAHNQNCIKNFGLEMHIGSISIKEILKAGHIIKIAKQQIDNYFSKAIIIGGGLRYAEQQIKSYREDEQKINDMTTELNLTGLECRWDKIKPPSEENEIVCYLIEALHPEKQINIYSEILQKIDEMFGDQVQRHPISPDRLKLLLSFTKLKKEMLAKYGKWKIGYFISTFVYTFFGRYYFKYNWAFDRLKGQDYLTQLIAHADTLVIDGRINTIISGRRDRHLLFMDYLSAREKEHLLVFGHHTSKESIITCYIENRNEKHMHFVDGSDGGYTEAAKGFKIKLKQFL
jgi:hypothetical protein